MAEMKTIAVIEDDTILLKALNVELLSSNFNVISASDGEAGLELVKKEKPDLVLLDLIMPKKTGFEVLEGLKKNKGTAKIPVIILSNLGQDEDIKKAKKLGAKDFYHKSSTNLKDLTEKINIILK